MLLLGLDWVVWCLCLFDCCFVLLCLLVGVCVTSWSCLLDGCGCWLGF